jgi:DNA invertase Pin-like site-specific DNA recombinase
MNVIGYVRASTGRQEGSPEAQRAAILAECKRRGWALVRFAEDVASGKSVARRPKLLGALDAIEAGEAEGLVVSKLDRLTRSLLDSATLMERARRRGWNIVVLDQNFDLDTPGGRAMAGMLAVFAQWEREMIGARTSEALAAKRAQGVRLGRPPTLDPAVRRRIRQLHRAGHSRAEIARRLNAESVPTAQGGRRWYSSSVLAVLRANA